jgi:hypothetical protein
MGRKEEGTRSRENNRNIQRTDKKNVDQNRVILRKSGMLMK